MKGHIFGITIFVCMKEDGTFDPIVRVPPHDPEDPWCFKCGQKLINTRSSNETCQGRDDGRVINIPDFAAKPPEVTNE